MSRLGGNVLVIALLMVSGCGTIGNLQNKEKVCVIYGGTILDGSEGWRATKELIDPGDSPDYTCTQDVAIMIFASIDTPLSFIADTFTLPITVPRTICRWLKPNKPSADPHSLPPTAPPVAQKFVGPPLASAEPRP